MCMLDALIMLGAGFLGGTLGGITLAGWYVSRLWRRCTTLEWAVADLQDRASTFRGRDMAEKRWEKARTSDAELAAALRSPVPTTRRYDNDPLGS